MNSRKPRRSPTMLRLRIVPDEETAREWPTDVRERAARGIECSPVKGGVLVRRLPGFGLAPPIFADCWAAVETLHRVADASEHTAKLAGGKSTATGAWLLDRSRFLRLAAQEITRYRARLWLAEETIP